MHLALAMVLTIIDIFPGVRSLDVGHIVQRGELPYMAKLCYQNRPQCPAIIIDDNKVVALATCFGDDFNADQEGSSWTVEVASREFSECQNGIGINNFRFHPDRFDNVNDIAVLKLSTGLQWTLTVQKIEIGPIPTDGCHRCIISGWKWDDELDDSRLVWLPVHIYDQPRCIDLGQEIGEAETCFVDPTFQAVITNVDYGSSVVCNGVLVGIISYVDHTDDPHHPHRMMVISYYKEFIDAN